MPFDFFGGVDYLSSLLTSFAFVNAACLSSRGAFAKSWSSINAATPRRTPPPRHRKACGLSPFPAGSASPSAVKKAASCERREASLTPCTNTLSPSSCATNAKSRLRGNAKHEMGGGLFKLTVVQGASYAAGTLLYCVRQSIVPCISARSPPPYCDGKQETRLLVGTAPGQATSHLVCTNIATACRGGY